jgi:hypothetical protein
MSTTIEQFRDAPRPRQVVPQIDPSDAESDELEAAHAIPHDNANESRPPAPAQRVPSVLVMPEPPTTIAAPNGREAEAVHEATPVWEVNGVAPETVLGDTMVRSTAPAAAGTDKTDETYRVSNGEFLQAVFGDELQDAFPVAVTFEGNPAHPKDWSGRPWQGNPETSTTLPVSTNNYFSLGAFRPDEAGRVRRQKKYFRALYAVMLDDVGTKVATGRLTLPPSWLLETSPGNHQAGFLLRQPLLDGTVAVRLMNAIVDAGLCDPRANGPTARLARLPEGVNGKHVPPFPCRMVDWSPERRYSVEDLVDGLQLEMTSAKQPGRRDAPTLHTRVIGENDKASSESDPLESSARALWRS